MKSKEVLELLQITRSTLCKYVREGIIETTVMTNGRYDYDYDSVYKLFNKYNCEIIVMSEVGTKKLDSEEIFEEIVALLNCYSMKLYSKRKISKIQEIISEEKNSLA